MASFLRQIVAGPRLQHPEAGLDLCYVTDNIIATSGPSAAYPQRAYRNPLDALVNFLDSKHGQDWCIWEFRAEGTGYPDSEVCGRIHHFPWPDHHPPPFALIPAIMGSMRNWLRRLDGNQGDNDSGKGKRVAVVHCKAGKGRSGTVVCSYLISEEGWEMEDALKQFTKRRMRTGFGAGVSIPSQLRWVKYVDRWTNEMGKRYIERPVEILELHVWGLRDGVKVAVEGFIDQGKKIKCFHLFHRSEWMVVDDGKKPTVSSEKKKQKKNGKNHNKNSDDDKNSNRTNDKGATKPSPSLTTTSTPLNPVTVTSPSTTETPSSAETGISAVLLRPSNPLILPSSDVNIDFERRSKAPHTGWTFVTSIAHVWFNAYFEGGDKHDSGVFETNWDCMDGIKGTSQKGIKALERLKVVWRYPPSPPPETPEEMKAERKEEPGYGQVLAEPKPGEPIPETRAANWRGQDPVYTGFDDGICSDNDKGNAKGAEPSTNEGGDTSIPSRALTETAHHPYLQVDAPEDTGLTAGSEHSYLTGLSTAAASAASTTANLLRSVERDLVLRKQAFESNDVSLANSADDLQQHSDPSAIEKGGEKENADNNTNDNNTNDNNQSANGDHEGVQSYFGNDGNGGVGASSQSQAK
ncbi:hypothetical protein MPDQ_000198 [Monascus purpureus]|uniref:phosphatidylinositol-3,4,5-trisphosphate 3-phosphatase n=1 Tax=Monascus purpureus TaxID=5098 RepID=A0A507R202_MONPU|nr:hypothetical protein MPDQ_000198 [Monascus purpureus]BDD59245.1 hypothetical protein MAP00_004467 [Monascus purpureus]